MLFFGCMLLSLAETRAQTPITKDAMNNFAQYTSSKDIKKLENARKLIDDAYKTKSDSNTFKNNLIRTLVYSTLARVDSNLKYSYKKDPLEVALHSLNFINKSKSRDDALAEITYIEAQLRQIYL